MEQISPVTILPQASYIDFVPTVERELDYKTLFSLEQQRQNAEYKKNQDRINNRIKIQAGVDKYMSDPNSPLGMVGDNDEQRAILGEIRTNAQPIINEINALQANPNYDENAILNAESKLSQLLYTNPGYRKVIEDKAKFGNHSKYADKLDPELWGEYQNKYYSYNGEGENPLTGFNPALMTPWDEAKYNNALKGINTEKEIIGMYNGIERQGVVLKPTSVFKSDMERLWNAQKRHLEKQGLDFNTWYESQYNNYYNGAGVIDGSNVDAEGNPTEGTIFRVTDALTAAQYKDIYGDDTTKTGNTKDGDKKNTDPVQDVWENKVVTSVPGAPLDGRFSGEQSQDLNPGLNLPQKAILLNDQIKENDNVYRELLKQKNAAAKAGNNAEERRLVNELKSLGNNIRKLKGLREEIKSDTYYTSNDYKKSHRELLNSLASYNFTPDIKGDGFLDSADRNKKALDFVTDKLKSTKSPEEFFNKLNALEIEYQSKPKSKANSDILYTIDKARVQAENRASLEYDKYATTNNIDNAQAPSSSFTFDSGDKDYKELIKKKYEGKTTNQLLTESNDVREVNGVKLKASDDEIVVPKRAIYDPKTGKYALLAEVGTPTQRTNKDGTTIIMSDEFTKEPEISKSRQVIIQDENINNKMFHTYFGDLGDKGVQEAKEIFKGMSKTLDINDKLSYKKTINGNQIQINKANEGYSLFINGQVVKSDNGEPIVSSKENIIKYILSPQVTGNNNSTTTTNNTSGGGNVGKLDKQSSSIKEGIRQAESGGEKDPARARNKETNALGYFGLVPSSQFDKLTPFVTKNWREFGVDLSKYTPEKIAAYKKELGRKEGAKGYSDEDIKAYMAIQDHPEMQDAYFDKVLMPKQYLPNVNKIIAAYAKNGKNINEAQAIDIMHHHGIGNAQDGNWQKYPARAWAASYQGENKKETQDVNNRIKNYNFAFQPGVNLSGVNKTMVDSTKHLIVKSGLDSLLPQVSSGKRDGNGASKHNHGEGIDFKFNTPSQEMEAINKIAKMTANPEAARQMLLKGKGTNGHNVAPLEIKVGATGQVLKIIYHGDSDGKGNHIHIQL